MTIKTQLLYEVWLNCCLSGDIKKIERCINIFENAEKFYINGGFNHKNLELLNFSKTHILNFNLNKVSEIINKCLESNINIITIFDEKYPTKLKFITNPPRVLYTMGDIGLSERVSIAAIGSREPTEYGIFMTKKIVYDLASCGFLIISGMAKGIDRIAHIAALKASGTTLAVLPRGIDKAYPKQNQDLYNLIKKKGILISELPPGIGVSQMAFEPRNRIMAGLSNGVFIIEAKLKSGTCYTVNHALNENRDIFALVGNVNSLNSEYPNKLVSEGATIVRTAEDIISHYIGCYNIDLSKAITSCVSEKLSNFNKIDENEYKNLPKSSNIVKKQTIKPEKLKDVNVDIKNNIQNTNFYKKLGDNEKSIINCLIKENDIHIDTLSRKCNINIKNLNSIMFHLQLEGIVKQNIGNTYTLSKNWNGE